MPFLLENTNKYTKLSHAIKILTADSIQKAASGHPGMPIGFSDVFSVLASDFLVYNPSDPAWFNRDRIILSAGHGSMLLYSFYYLAGYVGFNLEDIKNFRQLHSKTPGHPEYGAYSAIETTTGPLAQGLANAVGMAIAGKKYSKASSNIVNYKIYSIVGDGCLMEGLSYESASIAGHLNLNNLIVLFDDNHISIDGRTNLTISEDQLAKFASLGWNTERVDGHNYQAIHQALSRAQNSTKPYFIAMRTTIANECATKADSETSHGSPLGEKEITLLKNKLRFPQEPFAIPKEILSLWNDLWLRNKDEYNKWQEYYNRLSSKELSLIDMSYDINPNFASELPISNNAESTRVSSGKVLESLLTHNSRIICGSADLSLSNVIKNHNNTVITKDDFSGNFIHYGIREHAMAGIMNGLSLSGFLPIGGSFLVFSDYMRPAIRLAAIMKRHVIYVMTHDSIGVGEDGGTHQPVEHLASLRAIPNLNVMRPADMTETIECWQIAMTCKTMPHLLVLSRQNLPQLRNKANYINNSHLGAYIIFNNQPTAMDKDAHHCDIKIFATGSEVSLAVDVAQKLANIDLKVIVISIPSMSIFFKQEKNYIDAILQPAKLMVGIEAATSFGWERIIGNKGLFFGVEDFGLSAPAEDLYEYFNLTAQKIVTKVSNYFGKNSY